MANVPTTKDIVDQFEELLSTNPSVTTLDVKAALRAKDFWVSQDEVSTAMREYRASGEHEAKDPATRISVVFTGPFRVYSLIPSTKDAEDETSDDETPETSEVPKPQQTGDWECSVYGAPELMVIFRDMTRNQAKAKFAHEYDAEYSKIKAVKA